MLVMDETCLHRSLQRELHRAVVVVAVVSTATSGARAGQGLYKEVDTGWAGHWADTNPCHADSGDSEHPQQLITRTRPITTTMATAVTNTITLFKETANQRWVIVRIIFISLMFPC